MFLKRTINNSQIHFYVCDSVRKSSYVKRNKSFLCSVYIEKAMIKLVHLTKLFFFLKRTESSINANVILVISYDFFMVIRQFIIDDQDGDSISVKCN